MKVVSTPNRSHPAGSSLPTSFGLQSYSYSMKWYSYSMNLTSRVRVRVRVPPCGLSTSTKTQGFRGTRDRNVGNHEPGRSHPRFKAGCPYACRSNPAYTPSSCCGLSIEDPDTSRRTSISQVSFSISRISVKLSRE